MCVGMPCALVRNCKLLMFSIQFISLVPVSVGLDFFHSMILDEVLSIIVFHS
jgi:hypothetical protein